MSRVVLNGWIPVSVWVDLDAKEVTEVHAGDDCFEYEEVDKLISAYDGDSRDLTLLTEEDRALIDAARAIADEAEWPAWEWG